ncbi:MAG: CsgG/HfaB family protein [Kiritimatiellae bacterium]|nr:CsgG/HfaB family protein [Kiritimatiellia bacterium]MDD5520467.1 CsgG/HfaB family protein [Kiritimatiellia bacterium]
MPVKYLKAVISSVGFVLVMAASGCALLDQMVGTKTSDGDAKMELGEFKGLKHAVGCKDFQNQAGWSGRWDLGHNLSIMLESALYDTGRFVVVEREKLGDVLLEQDLVASGRTAKAKKVAQTGLVRPARYIATGAVTTAEEGTSGGLGGISFRNISLGGGKSSAQITIIAKLVDTTTSEVVAKKSIVGKAGRVNMNVGLSVKGISTELGGFKKTPMGEAAQDCINQAAIFLAKEMEKIKFDGCVVKVSGNTVIINRGSEFGVEVGQTMSMVEEGELLTDPNSGAILGREKGKVLGSLKVSRVDEKMSYCDIVSGEKSPKPGTLVIKE